MSAVRWQGIMFWRWDAVNTVNLGQGDSALTIGISSNPFQACPALHSGEASFCSDEAFRACKGELHAVCSLCAGTGGAFPFAACWVFLASSSSCAPAQAPTVQHACVATTHVMQSTHLR